MKAPILRLACALLYAGSVFCASLYLCGRYDRAGGWSISATSLVWATMWTVSVMQPLVEMLRTAEPEGVQTPPRGHVRLCNLFHVLLVILWLGYGTGVLTSSILFAALIFVIHPVFFLYSLFAISYGVVSKLARPVEVLIAVNAIAVHCGLLFREYFIEKGMWI